MSRTTIVKTGSIRMPQMMMQIDAENVLLLSERINDPTMTPEHVNKSTRQHEVFDFGPKKYYDYDIQPSTDFHR